MASFVIRISSLPGGTGKSVLAINLALALASLGKKVLLIDTDAVSPAIASYLNVTPKKTYYDILINKVHPKDAVIKYKPGKIDLILSEPFPMAYKLTKKQVETAGKAGLKLGYDFIVADTPKGIFFPVAAELYSAALVISTPFYNSVANNCELHSMYKKSGISCNLVVNKFGRSANQMSKKEIMAKTGEKILAIIPEDQVVEMSIYKKKPAFLINRNSKFSKAILKLAKSMVKAAKNGSVDC